MTYYLSRGGRSLGPYTENELHRMLSAGEVQRTDQVCTAGGSEWIALGSVPGFGFSLQPSREGDEAVSALIPYKNPQALTAYYLGVFSLIPCIGLALAIPACILGVVGLRKARENPGSKGTAHAWVGIVLGALMTLLWTGATVAFFISVIR